jgi:hypothetical protein
MVSWSATLSSLSRNPTWLKGAGQEAPGRQCRSSSPVTPSLLRAYLSQIYFNEERYLIENLSSVKAPYRYLPV